MSDEFRIDFPAERWWGDEDSSSSKSLREKIIGDVWVKIPPDFFEGYEGKIVYKFLCGDEVYYECSQGRDDISRDDFVIGNKLIISQEDGNKIIKVLFTRQKRFQRPKYPNDYKNQPDYKIGQVISQILTGDEFKKYHNLNNQRDGFKDLDEKEWSAIETKIHAKLDEMFGEGWRESIPDKNMMDELSFKQRQADIERGKRPDTLCVTLYKNRGRKMAGYDFSEISF